MSDPPGDPTGKRSLFEAAGRGISQPAVNGGVNGGPTGKAALFSAHAPRPASGETRNRTTVPTRAPGTVVVECSSCRASSRLSLADVGRRMLTGSAWLPLLRPAYPHWLRCPACGQRRWCRIGWNE